MNRSYEDRVVALGGIVQAAQLVVNAARTGMLSQDSFESTVRSLFVFDPASTQDVYGGLGNLRPGLRMTAELLAGVNLRDHADLLRYVFAMLAAERALARNREMWGYLGERLGNIHRHLVKDNEGALDDTAIAAVAALYQQTISTLEPRIRIVGDRRHLQNEYNVNRIRAMLLAGIRSAVLWRQVGGRRWQLLLARGRLGAAMNSLESTENI